MICCSGCFDTPDGLLDSLWRQSEGEWFCPACVEVFGIREQGADVSEKHTINIPAEGRRFVPADEITSVTYFDPYGERRTLATGDSFWQEMFRSGAISRNEYRRRKLSQ